ISLPAFLPDGGTESRVPQYENMVPFCQKFISDRFRFPVRHIHIAAARAYDDCRPPFFVMQRIFTQHHSNFCMVVTYIKTLYYHVVLPPSIDQTVKVEFIGIFTVYKE